MKRCNFEERSKERTVRQFERINKGTVRFALALSFRVLLRWFSVKGLFCHCASLPFRGVVSKVTGNQGAVVSGAVAA